MNTLPRITLVTPNYNLGEFLESTIRSVVDQGYPNLEYVIVDGGSTDNSASIIERYRQHFSKVIIEKDNGHSDALDKGFRNTTGSIMGWINSDDILLPGSLFLVARLFQQLGHVSWIQGNQTLMSEDGMIVRSGQPRPISRLRCLAGDYRWIQQESTFWTRTLWDAAGAYIDKTAKIAVDFELWMRFFRLAHLYPVQGGIGAFRSRTGQKSGAQQAEYERETLALIEREIGLLPEDYKKKHSGLIPSKARTMEAAERDGLTALKEHDLRHLRFDLAAKSFVDDNPPASRRPLAKPAAAKPVAPVAPPKQTLESMRGRHRGGRIFLMGNGPSLNKMDLELLKHEPVFGCNSCFLLFDRVSWRPRYYTCVDTRVLPDRAADIVQMHDRHPEMELFFPDILRVYDGTGRRTPTTDLIPPRPNVHFFKDYAPQKDRLPYSAFSLDAVKGLAIPNTVTITMMQLAYFLGFDEIYLIGCDTSYVVPKSVVQDGPELGKDEKLFLTSTEDDDPNHFDKSYFGKGRAWHNPKVEDMIEHYAHAKTVLDELGVRVFNATVGGNLEVFPRAEFNSLFA